MDENNRDIITENIDKEVKDELSYDNENFSENEIKIDDEQKPKSMAKEIYEWISSVAVAVVLALIINTFLFSLVQVSGDSMLPTLVNGERLVVRKLTYTPENSDIVIVKSKPLQKFIVKRVVAKPSQTVGFDAELNLLVDGEMVEENYIKSRQQNIGYLYNYPVVVPQKGASAELGTILVEQANLPDKVTITQLDGKIYVEGSEFVEDGEFIFGETKYTQDAYFVLGDNRNNSADSRFFGFVPESEIIGKAIFRIFPFNVFGTVE